MVWIRPFTQLGEERTGLAFSASLSPQPSDSGFLQLLPKLVSVVAAVRRRGASASHKPLPGRGILRVATELVRRGSLMENSPRARLGSHLTLEVECAAGCLSISLLLGPNPKRGEVP